MAGPIPGEGDQAGVDAVAVAGGGVGLDVGEGPVDRRPRRRQDRRRPVADPHDGAHVVLARAQQVGGAGEAPGRPQLARGG